MISSETEKMGRGSKAQKKAYIRYLSCNIRKWTPKHGEIDYVEDDPIIEGLEGLGLSIMLILGRNRNRLLQQAWNFWIKNTCIVHDYTADVISILSNPIGVSEMRTELELEVMYKWALQQSHLCPTGLAYNLSQCRSRNAVVNVLQQCRLEIFNAKELILYQDTLPQPEDGLFTILRGSCDVIHLNEGSVTAIKLQEYFKRNKFDSAKELLEHSRALTAMHAPSGFGELSCLTGVKRHATIRAGRIGASLIIVPQPTMLACFESRRSGSGTGVPGSAPGEAIEMFRQVGLATKISPSDVMNAANSMIKHTLEQGDVLYFKHQPARSTFLVVSGDIVLDTGEPIGIDPAATAKQKPEELAFLTSIQERCFHLSSGSILGDEGCVGLEAKYDSTAAVASPTAVVFEASGGFGLRFLHERINGMRYAALAYKELPRWSLPIQLAEMTNIYGNLNSLRRCIAHSKPFRGTAENPYQIQERASFSTPSQAAKKEADDKIALMRASTEKRRPNQGPAGPAENGLCLASSKRFPKLTFMGIMLLKQINLACKKQASEKLKLHARENILRDELLSANAHVHGTEQSAPPDSHGAESRGSLLKTPLAAASKSTRELESKLRRGLKGYHERNKANVAEEVEVEGPKITIAAASKMLNMFSSAAGVALKRGSAPASTIPEGEGASTLESAGGAEVSEDTKGDHDQDAETQSEASDLQSICSRTPRSSRSNDELSAACRQEILSMSRIEQYLLYHRKRSESSTAPNTVHISISANADDDARDAIVESKSGDEKRDSLEPAFSPLPITDALPRSTGTKTNEINWRPPSPPAASPEDPLLASSKSCTTTKGNKLVVPKQLWPTRTQGKGNGEATLSSLQYNALSYEERLKAVPSSGYGQQKVHLTVKERAEAGSAQGGGFCRMAAPNARQIALLPWQLEQQLQHIQLLTSKEKGAKNKSASLLPTEVSPRIGECDSKPGASDDKDFDIDETEVFLKLLSEKEFSVRSQHRPGLGWMTRTMKVTNNSTADQGAFIAEPKGVSKTTTRGTRKATARANDHAQSASSSLSESGMQEMRLEEAAQDKNSQVGLREVKDDGQVDEQAGDSEEKNFDLPSRRNSLDSAAEASIASEGVSVAELSAHTTQSLATSTGERESTATATVVAQLQYAGDPAIAQSGSIDPEKTSAPFASSDNLSLPPKTIPQKSGSRVAVREAAIQWSTTKASSPALRAFRDVLEKEYSSRQYLDGKKKHDAATCFMLDLPPDVAKASDTFPEFGHRSRESKEHLLQSLLPPGTTLNPFGAIKVKKKSGKKGSIGELSSLVSGSEMDSSIVLEASSQLLKEFSETAASAVLSLKRNDDDLAEWKKFSVEVSVKNKTGPQWTLPVLEGASDDPTQPIRKKSGLKFSGGRLARSGDVQNVIEKESYLQVYQRTFSKRR